MNSDWSLRASGRRAVAGLLVVGVVAHLATVGIAGLSSAFGTVEPAQIGLWPRWLGYGSGVVLCLGIWSRAALTGPARVLALFALGALLSHVVHMRVLAPYGLDIWDRLGQFRAQLSAVYWGVPWLSLLYLGGCAVLCRCVTHLLSERTRLQRRSGRGAVSGWIGVLLFVLSAVLVVQFASGGQGF